MENKNTAALYQAFQQMDKEYLLTNQMSDSALDQLGIRLMKVCRSHGLYMSDYAQFVPLWDACIGHPERVSVCTLPECFELLTYCQRQHYWSYDYQTYIIQARNGMLPALVSRIKQLLETA